MGLKIGSGSADKKIREVIDKRTKMPIPEDLDPHDYWSSSKEDKYPEDMWTVDILGRYNFSVKDVIEVCYDPVSPESDIHVKQVLDKCSSISYSVACAKEDVARMRRSAELDYKEWEAEKWKQAEMKILSEKDKKIDKITIQEIKNQIIIDNKDEYHRKQENISELKRMENRLQRTFDIIMARQVALESILRNREELKKSSKYL